MYMSTMASLEAVGFLQDPFGYCGGVDDPVLFDEFDIVDKLAPLDFGDILDTRIIEQLDGFSDYAEPAGVEAVAVAEGESQRAKRRRGRSRKNKEEIEIQRMTHIAVERNRRKQMNEYLSVLRSLMPESYVPRSDQASIIGGAINYVKELEQQLHLLGARKQSDNNPLQPPFSDCFGAPQYSSSFSTASPKNPATAAVGEVAAAETPQQNEVADIEVTMVERHANVKIRSKRRPKQLLRLVSGLQALRLTVLHLNVSTAGEVVLYSLSLKAEDQCKMTSVDEMASAVYQIFVKVEEEEEEEGGAS
ncbi:hypothetical protein SAY86_001398 [Trapa natans]|uniref:BHLH domain-containing protein n=1 Tax=Trapa natans TaxID=22666 RepID=A0AAN7RHK2_TRANT|nr:hypothetical protein SAY86_001398 [Trapa natans]